MTAYVALGFRPAAGEERSRLAPPPPPPAPGHNHIISPYSAMYILEKKAPSLLIRVVGGC